MRMADRNANYASPLTQMMTSVRKLIADYGIVPLQASQLCSYSGTICDMALNYMNPSIDPDYY